MTTVGQLSNQVKHIWQQGSFQTELDDALHQTLRHQALAGVKATLETALERELDAHLGFAHHQQRTVGGKPPEQQRSGFFLRGLATEFGTIADLRVPKLRAGNAARVWQVLTRHQSVWQSLLDKGLYLYGLGLSLRDLQEIFYLLFDNVLSVSAVNQVTLTAQAAMSRWRQQPLADTPPILLVDGVWVKILYPTGETWTDQSGHQRRTMRGQEQVLLAALGVWPDGRHYLLHYLPAKAEQPESWAAFFQQLSARGLVASSVQLVVSDGSSGLLEALATALPHAQLQRCVVHKVRGMERYLSYSALPSHDSQSGQALSESAARLQRRQQIKAAALEIFDAPTQREAQQRLAAFEAHWTPLEPKAVHNFTWGIKRCFHFYQFPTQLHPLIRSTNTLERFFREFRDKADEIGSFPNEASALTIFHLVMVREHAKHHRVAFVKT